MKRLLWFLIAGGSGFLIDAGITLALIEWTPAGPYIARAIAIFAAMGFTWFVNRNYTFGRSSHSLTIEGIRYWTVGITAALVNYVVYSVLLYRAPVLQPLAAIVFASLAGMAYSFFGYSRFVFRR
ncbi:GtrA family protein [Rhizobium sp. LCM 4573]|uniref:GtrA family protein n=1 Tax=Rhizobium sp. LCM 4573 TaxID=1848291 RepID=UPI0008DAD816|nr:GtrA family protein [Rhizobium sp. LCM 4573]OHV78988.1 hypothetical protein LCM4573_07050 [Rhizobium sp. LCM 4573]